ncbi:MAG TPA: LpqB family beta-propeller domain-containing protein [Actinopolymorphaceae bacterium]
MRRLLISVVCALVLSSGCVAIPTVGPVEQIELDPERQEEEDTVQVVPKPPRPGLSPQQIVGEFIDTMGARQPTRHAALFLTSRSRASWQPTGVTVLERPDITPVEGKFHLVHYKARQVATIRDDGSWSPSPPNTEYDLTFRLVSEQGQWRIDNPPKTLLLTIDNVNRGFGQYNLFFYDATSQVLVPDPVYLPLGKGIETRLINALLRGPTAWLRPAARSALPEGLRMAGPSVTVKGPVATVDLNQRLLDLSTGERARAVAQIAWTLDQVGIERVRILVEGVPVQIGGSSETVPDPDLDPGVGDQRSQPCAVSDDGRIVQVTAGTGLIQDQRFTDRRFVSPRAIAPGPVPERPDARERDNEPEPGHFATVSADGRALWIHRGRKVPEKPAYQGTDIVAPSWDRTGKLWFADDVAGENRLMLVDEKSEVLQVPFQIPGDARVTALSVSRDGTRLATIVEQDGVDSLVVGRIDRGSRPAVREPVTIPLQTKLASLIDLGWSEITELVVLGLDDSDQSHVLRVAVDGSMQREYDGAPQARQLAASPGQPILLAGGRDGLLQRPHEEFGWTALGSATLPAYPG